MRMLTQLAICAFLSTLFSVSANAGSVFLTGHDPDFHAHDSIGARNINTTALDYILDPLHNDIVAGGTSKFLYVESFVPTPSGHRIGSVGLVSSGYALGTDFEKHDATTLGAELDLLGTKYAGLVVGSDFGGLLTQAELNIMNARTSDIFDFLNIKNGGLFAMSESGHGAGLTIGGWFGFMPFVVSSVPASQSEVGTTVTAFGASLGLTNADVSSNFSHNIFDGAAGLNVVDTDSLGRILSLAGRGEFDPGTGLSTVPLPASAFLLLASLGGIGVLARRHPGSPSGRRRRL